MISAFSTDGSGFFNRQMTETNRRYLHFLRTVMYNDNTKGRPVEVESADGDEVLILL